MGWLTNASKDIVDLRDGRQSFMQLDAAGGGRNNAGTVEQDGSFGNYAVNGYGRNELAYACIRYRAESLPQATIRVYQSDDATEISEHPLRKLFERPNPITNEFEFFELSSTYKDLAGTCFWLAVKGRNGQVAELWPLRPDLLAALPNPRDLADFTWIYRPDPERPEIAVPVPPAGTAGAAKKEAFIIRVRYPNPNPRDLGWRYFGMPPLRPGARAVTLDNGATDFVDKLLRNHAMPSVVIETEQEITPKVHERLTAMWGNAFGGARRGTPAFMQKGMKLHELGLSLTNLEFPDLRAVSETRICMAFAVEPILVGAKIGLEHNAYKDYREARLSFWEETMFTEERRFIEPVRQHLAPLFAGAGRRSTKVRWDNSEVLALKEATGALWERSANAFRAGGITQNDFRRFVGLAPVPNGDVFLIPAGVTPTPIDADPAAAVQAATQPSADGAPSGAPSEAAAAAQAKQEAGSVAASLGMLAAEYGLELTRDELAMAAARASWEG
jgi:phage portal protein BeeE